MNEVIAFLLARISEQQIAAARGLQTQAEHPDDDLNNRVATQRIGAAPPAQILRDCEAKRRIVAQLDLMLEGRRCAMRLSRSFASSLSPTPTTRTTARSGCPDTAR